MDKNLSDMIPSKSQMPVDYHNSTDVKKEEAQLQSNKSAKVRQNEERERLFDQLETQVKQTRSRLSEARRTLDKPKIKSLLESQIDKCDVNEIYKSLDDLETAFKAFESIRMQWNKISGYLFRPIINSQRFSLIFTFIFGTIGVLTAVPIVLSFLNGLFGEKEVDPWVVDEKLLYFQKQLGYGAYSETITEIENYLQNQILKKDVAARVEVLRLAALIKAGNDQGTLLDLIKESLESYESFAKYEYKILQSFYSFKYGNTQQAKTVLRECVIGAKSNEQRLQTLIYEGRLQLSAVSIDSTLRPEGLDKLKTEMLDAQGLMKDKDDPVYFDIYELSTLSLKRTSQELINELSRKIRKIAEEDEERRLIGQLQNTRVAIVLNKVPPDRFVHPDVERVSNTLKSELSSSKTGTISKLDLPTKAFPKGFQDNNVVICTDLGKLYFERIVLNTTTYKETSAWVREPRLKNTFPSYDLVIMVSHK